MFKAYIKVSPTQLITLIHNLKEAAADADVGVGDAENSLEDYLNNLNRKFSVPKDLVEGCLWACTMMQERNKFQSVLGMDYKKLLTSFSDRYKFSPETHCLEERYARKSN